MPGIESLSARRTKTIIALGVAALTGCELVAGIQDITSSGTASPDAAAGDDATMGQGDSGSDAAPSPEAAADQSVVPMPDVYDAGSQGDASGNAPGDAFADAAGDVVSPMVDVTPPPDAGDGGAAVDAAEGAAPDAAPVSFVVPIPGPDGGALSSDGGDGGPLLGELIDDIDSETMPGWIPIKSGRVGTWFSYDDGTAGGVVPAPMSPPAMSVGPIVGWDGNTANLAAHMTGSGLALYAGMGFDLNAYNNVASTYDATAYRGFTFWGRIGGTTGTASVKFAVPDINTNAVGGVCTAASDGSSSGCGDYFSKLVILTPIWRQFVVYYGQLGQAGFGVPKGLAGLDAAHVYSCEFQVGPGPAFDIWIDDVYFISK